MQKCASSLGLHAAVSGLILAALLLIAAPATAARLIDLDPSITEEIWFPVASGNTGVAAPRAAEYVWNPSYQPLCTGGGDFDASSEWCVGHDRYELEVISQLPVQALQFPQSYGADVSIDDPFVADTLLTVRNNTDITLSNTLLIFTRVDLEDSPGTLPDPYPNLFNDDPSAVTGDGKDASAFGLDARADLLKILEFFPGGPDGGPYFFAVGELGNLGPGDTAELTVRYIVNNEEMPTNADGVILLPPLDVLGAVVPEPSTGILLGTGLLGLAIAGQRRS